MTYGYNIGSENNLFKLLKEAQHKNLYVTNFTSWKGGVVKDIYNDGEMVAEIYDYDEDYDEYDNGITFITYEHLVEMSEGRDIYALMSSTTLEIHCIPKWFYDLDEEK